MKAKKPPQQNLQPDQFRSEPGHMVTPINPQATFPHVLGRQRFDDLFADTYCPYNSHPAIITTNDEGTSSSQIQL